MINKIYLLREVWDGTILGAYATYELADKQRDILEEELITTIGIDEIELHTQ